MKKALLGLLFSFCFLPVAFAGELYVQTDSLSVSRTDALEGQELTVYATVYNRGGDDLRGVVQFIHNGSGNHLGSDIPVALVAGSNTKVFTKWTNLPYGKQTITLRVQPWEQAGDDPGNNSTTLEVFIDRDSDQDGKPDEQDPDDDNDGTPDEEDAFPLDPKESKDTDGDGTGDNADNDDDGDQLEDSYELELGLDPLNPDSDGDGVKDGDDLFPRDPKESIDSDQDGIGDNQDDDDDNDGVPDSEDAFPLNHAPIVHLNGPSGIRKGEEATFDAFGSEDPDGAIRSWSWMYRGAEISTASQATILFEEGGTHTLSLTITDDTGESSTKELRISVHQPPPLFQILILLLVLILLGWLSVRYLGIMKKAAQEAEEQPQDSPKQ